MATRGKNKNKKGETFPALSSEMITMKPRFIYKKQKNDICFYSWLIPKNKVSFENSCEDYLSLSNWMDIPNVLVLIEESIQNMAQDISWLDEICCCSVFLNGFIN